MEFSSKPTRLVRFYLLLTILTSPLHLYAQKDTEFWFVAPAISENHCNGAPNCNTGAAPVSFVITTFDHVAIVTIEQPANDIDDYPVTGFTPIIDTIPAHSTRRIELWSDNFGSIPDETQMRKNVENRPDDVTVRQRKGIHITSTNYITVYYEVEEDYNSDVFALKGSNALGTDFYATFQTNQDNHYFDPDLFEPLYSAIDIVAVDAGITEVVIYPTNPVLGFGQPDSIVISLEYGETFSLIPGYIDGGGDYVYNLDPEDRLSGTRIKTRGGKRIAVTLKDDSVHGDSGCWDLLGDQTIPVEAISDSGTTAPLIGAEYVVMKGDLGWARPSVPPVIDFDRAYILATQDGTHITITDVTNSITYDTTINAGDQIQHDIADNADITYIASDNDDKPVYVMHVTGAQGGCEIGEAVLPSISGCTGSFRIGFSRSELNNPSDKDFFITILGRTGALDGFVLNGDSTSINPAAFTHIPGTDWWASSFNKSAEIPDGSVNMLENYKDIFHLGIMHGGEANGGNYGYFSNYNEIAARSYVAGTGQPGAKICYGETIQLVASGGIDYEWSPPDYLDDPYTDQPYCTPFSSKKYRVIVKGASCTEPDTAWVPVNVADSLSARFLVNPSQGCAPLEIDVTNDSYGAIEKFCRWEWGDGTYTFGNLDPPNHIYRNTTDTIIDYVIRLVVRNEYCAKSWERTIRVYPEINAGFTLDTTIGCHPLTVQFTDTSSGNLDTLGYFWDFGDFAQSFETDPQHTFTNIGSGDSVFTVSLVTQSPYFCTDTAEADITVHPIIQAKLAIDTAISCSPLDNEMDASKSIGVDTFFWTIDYPLSTDIIKTQNPDPIAVLYSDTSQLNGPDTLKVNLSVMNEYGCSSSVQEKKIIVYPEVEALFDIDQQAICDSSAVQFTNLSTGYSLLNSWDFGDGRMAQDTVKDGYNMVFRNQTTSTKYYTVTLETISDYFCSSSFDTTIIVHPFVKANFTVDYLSNCSPLDATIYNQSVRVNNYWWDFGDGSPVSNTSAAEFHHQFENPLEDSDTTYTIKLLVENLEGCRDSLQRDILLFPQVVAAFNMIDSVGCNPLTVSFTNNSKGKDLMYDWEFGNISSSISDKTFERTFSHYGSSDSTFMVTLNAYNGLGCDSMISKPVTLYAYIDADFTVENADSCSPFDIRINNNSPAGVQHTYWSFGDGETSTQFEPEHRYTNQSLIVRTDNLQLVVKNNHNCYDTMQRPVTVYPEINAGFMLDTTRGCQPLEIAITNNTNILSGTDFNWDFGDNTTSAAQDPPNKIYTNTGPNSAYHAITLDAVSQYGCSDNTSVAVEVYPYIRAKFTIDKPFICSDEMFGIDRSASAGGIDSYYWDYDGIDNSSRTDEIYDYTFTNTGSSSDSKTITLTVSNIQGCDTSWSENMLVHPEVRADFDIDTNEYCYPHVFSFTNTSNLDVANRHTWNFDDGSSSSETHPDHFFVHLDNEQDKEFDISLYAESDYGCNNSISKTLTVHPKPKADFNFPVTVDCPPFTVPFTNSSRGTDLNYNWDFDNGNYSTDENPEETFNNTSEDVEEKIVQLIATTTFGCRDTLVKTISIYPQVSVDFEASQWEGCNPLSVSFDGTAANENEHTWYVDGEAFSTLVDATHRFVNKTPNDKTFDVRFYARSIYNCMADTVKQVTVFPSPEAEFVPEPVLQDYNTETDITTVTLKNYTFNQKNFSYAWDFGDGTSSSDDRQSLVKEYSIWGNINNKNQLPVKLVAWNANHPECTDTVIHHIIINPPLPEIDLADDISDCVPFTVDFSATTKYIYEGSYQWDFGFNSATSSATEPVFTYTEPGTYIAKLFVEGDGGLNWDYKKIIVYPKPDVNFSFTPEKVLVESQITDPKPVKFFNHTEDGESFEWLFGDGAMSFEEEPSHIYRDTGLFNVTLIAITPFGCMDTLVHETQVYVYGEGKLIFPTAFMVDPAGPADEYYDPENPDPYIFRPVASGVKEYHLSIYNRWGVLLFETDDVNRGWNGYIDGEMTKQDVYVWKVKARFTNGEPYVAAGDVTLLKAPAP